MLVAELADLLASDAAPTTAAEASLATEPATWVAAETAELALEETPLTKPRSDCWATPNRPLSEAEALAYCEEAIADAELAEAAATDEAELPLATADVGWTPA